MIGIERLYRTRHRQINLFTKNLNYEELKHKLDSTYFRSLYS